MKVTTQFRVATKEGAENHGFPTIAWKASIDGTQLGEAWWWNGGQDGRESEADTLIMVLKQAAKDIKYFQKHGRKRKC